MTDVGDLLFAEPFGAVENGKHSDWVSILLDAAFGISVMGLVKRMPSLKLVLPLLPLKEAAEKLLVHERLTAEKVHRRLQNDDANHREDLFSHIIRHNLRTERQLAVEAPSLLAAGADTTAHTLAVAFYFLTRYPESLQKLRDEIDRAFQSYEDIKGDTVATLPYLNAVLEES